MRDDDKTCQYCGRPMELRRTRKLKTGTYRDPDTRQEKHYSMLLGDYRCEHCGAMLREGSTREHDIWISGLFWFGPKQRVLS